VPSEHLWATLGLLPVAFRLHGRWRVAPIARRHQQARAAVPQVAAQLEAHAQPAQLVRAVVGRPPPHAMALHHCPVPSRAARPTRRAPSRSQAMRWSWPCAAAHSRARYRLRSGRIVRVEHAETARVRPWAAPYRPAAPGRRVALRTDRRRRDRAAPAVRRGVRARCRLRARPVVRVEHAETAWVRPGAKPRPCVSPRRRVAGLHERAGTPPP